MKKTGKYVLWGLLVVVLIGGGIGFYMFNKKVPTLEHVAPDFTLEAQKLYHEFEENETVALTKYEDKVLQVEGTIMDVVKNDSNANVILDGGMMGGVNCSFKHKLETEMRKGDLVVIRGQCQGFLMDVVLNNCFLIEEK